MTPWKKAIVMISPKTKIVKEYRLRFINNVLSRLVAGNDPFNLVLWDYLKVEVHYLSFK